jgi:hypothetical protein
MLARLARGAVLLVFWTLSRSADAQILNIEKKRLERPDDEYVVGNLGANFAYTNRSPTLREPARVLNTGLTANVAYFSDHNAYMLISDYQLLRINENSFVDTGVTHLRIQFLHEKTLGYEIYTQHQYDRPRGLTFRGLVGAGGRLRLVQTDLHNLTAGLGAFYERERWLQPDDEGVVDARFVKGNSYLSYRLKISETSDLNGVVYYQIGHDRAVDLFRHRMTGELNLSVKIFENFSLTSSFIGAYETRPLVPILRFIFATTNGVRLDF